MESISKILFYTAELRAIEWDEINEEIRSTRPEVTTFGYQYTLRYGESMQEIFLRCFRKIRRLSRVRQQWLMRLVSVHTTGVVFGRYVAMWAAWFIRQARKRKNVAISSALQTLPVIKRFNADIYIRGHGCILREIEDLLAMLRYDLLLDN